MEGEGSEIKMYVICRWIDYMCTVQFFAKTS